eukprot:2944309-Prymnesium_polylepis.1
MPDGEMCDGERRLGVAACMPWAAIARSDHAARSVQLVCAPKVPRVPDVANRPAASSTLGRSIIRNSA